MDDLNGLIAGAIHLHDEERDLRQWEYDLDLVEAGLANFDLSQVANLCRCLAAVQSASSIAFEGSCAVHAQIRERATRPILIEGGTKVAGEQAAEAQRLGARHLTVRKRMRELDGAIGEAIAAYRGRDLEQRLLRLAGGAARDWSINELTDLVRTEHFAVSEALGDWRLMHSPAVIQIAGSNTRGDVVDALGRMMRDGRAIRDHSFTRGPRWTLIPGIAKAA